MAFLFGGESKVTVPGYGQMTPVEFVQFKKRLNLPSDMMPKDIPPAMAFLGRGMAEGSGASIVDRNNRLRQELSKLGEI